MGRKKIEVNTNNDLGEFLTGNVEVKKRGKKKVISEVKTEVNVEVDYKVTFTKQDLLDMKFEIEVLPSGNKTNLYHSFDFRINGFRPMRSHGKYSFTIHHPPDKIYFYIKQLELV